MTTTTRAPEGSKHPAGWYWEWDAQTYRWWDGEAWTSEAQRANGERCVLESNWPSPTCPPQSTERDKKFSELDLTLRPRDPRSGVVVDARPDRKLPDVQPSPFPGNPGRTIRLNRVPFGMTIQRSVFRPEEVAWMNAEIERIAQRPELWVPALMAHQEAHRQLVLDIGKLARGSVGAFGMRRGYPMRAEFVAKWNVSETLWRRYISPENKPEFAAQLRTHPYEAEVLRNSKYFGPAISGVQVAFEQATPDASSADDMKSCPYCAEVIKAKAIVCRYCNRDLPADTA